MPPKPVACTATTYKIECPDWWVAISSQVSLEPGGMPSVGNPAKLQGREENPPKKRKRKQPTSGITWRHPSSLPRGAWVSDATTQTFHHRPTSWQPSQTLPQQQVLYNTHLPSPASKVIILMVVHEDESAPALATFTRVSLFAKRQTSG